MIQLFYYNGNEYADCEETVLATQVGQKLKKLSN